MKKDIHPNYKDVTVTCGCGNSFVTRSTALKIAVEVCANCHPFFTGKQKFLDTAGMVEKFTRKWEGQAAQKLRATTAVKPPPRAPASASTASPPKAQSSRDKQTLAATLGAPVKPPAPKPAAPPAPAKAEGAPKPPAPPVKPSSAPAPKAGAPESKPNEPAKKD